MIGTDVKVAFRKRKPKSLDDVVRRISDISTLPHVALKVMEVARDSEAGAADLKTVVEGDPALCTRVLRSVNSAANALRTRITSVQQAISYLGFNQIRNLAITASVSTIFEKDEAIGDYQRTRLWRHMVSVGVCARLIASRFKLPNFEDAFLAGLLHDIGIILEDQHAHAGFRDVIMNLPEGKTLAEVEREYIGFDHTVLGERIAETWQFPPVAKAAIRFHHDSQQYTGEGAEIVRCVEVGNVICTLKGIMSVGVRRVRPPMGAMQALGLQKEDFRILADDLDRELELNESLFEL